MPPRLARSFALPPTFLLPRPVLVPKRTFRSIDKPKRMTRYDRGPGLPVLRSTPEAALERRARTLPPRTGVLATKKGMSSIYDSEGTRRACTVVQLDRVQVVAHRTRQRHGYFAVQIGAGFRSHARETRAMLGHFAAAGVAPKSELAEFRVRDASGLLPLGSQLAAGWFKAGQYVDAKANCKGKGFAGPMKRHGMKGQPASHGVSLVHRSLGSAGQSQGGGSRVYPGKRMAGNMGGQRVTVQNLEVLEIDEPKGLMVIAGCIPGPNGCFVELQDSIKRPWPEGVPTQVEGPLEEATA